MQIPQTRFSAHSTVNPAGAFSEEHYIRIDLAIEWEERGGKLVDYTIHAGKVIDGSSGPPMNDVRIEVEKGKIVHIESTLSTSPGPTKPKGKVIHLESLTVLPGLIDCHVHLTLPGQDLPLTDYVNSPDVVLGAVAAQNGMKALRAGITTVRDCGGKGRTTIDLSHAVKAGYVQGPTIVSCGAPLTITGGHCWFWGGEADGIDDVRHQVRELSKSNADYIKVMASGGGTPGTCAWLPSYTAKELQVITEEAHHLGKKVVVHSLNTKATENAIAAGVDEIEHAHGWVDAQGTQDVQPEIANAIAKAGIRVCETLSVNWSLIEFVRKKAKVTEEDEQLLQSRETMHESLLQQLKLLVDAGVKIVAGTDAGWRVTPFDALTNELILMHQGGLSRSQAILSATSQAAEAIGLADQKGRLAKGYDADIIAVDGDPLESLEALRQIRFVMKSGSVIYSE